MMTASLFPISDTDFWHHGISFRHRSRPTLPHGYDFPPQMQMHIAIRSQICKAGNHIRNSSGYSVFQKFAFWAFANSGTVEICISRIAGQCSCPSPEINHRYPYIFFFQSQKPTFYPCLVDLLLDTGSVFLDFFL